MVFNSMHNLELPEVKTVLTQKASQQYLSANQAETIIILAKISP